MALSDGALFLVSLTAAFGTCVYLSIGKSIATDVLPADRYQQYKHDLCFYPVLATVFVLIISLWPLFALGMCVKELFASAPSAKTVCGIPLGRRNRRAPESEDCERGGEIETEVGIVLEQPRLVAEGGGVGGVREKSRLNERA